MDSSKVAEIRSAEQEVGFSYYDAKPFLDWGARYWLKWATISEVLHRCALGDEASVLDVG